MPTDHGDRGWTRLAIVGAGRLGSALCSALPGAVGPLGRGAETEGFEAVLLCVPDGQLARAAAVVPTGRLVGHCCGACGLDVLAPHESFSIHPLMTVTDRGAEFGGAAAAVDATSSVGLAYAERLTLALGMRPLHVVADDRAAYHAAASIASNFLVSLEAAAEELGRTAGIDRAALVPLVRATVENWAALGPERALTGPVARRDDQTVARQRRAVAERTPELLALFDALTDATRRLAGACA